MNIQTIERAKLRQLRNEINTAAQARLEYHRNYTSRGYPRQALPSMRNPKNQSANRTCEHDLPELLRSPRGQDVPGQIASQSDAGRDCAASGKSAKGDCAGACGRCGAWVTA